MSRLRPSNAATGVLVAAVIVACCALPLLVSAGLLTGLGAALRSPLLIISGPTVAVVAAGYARHRHRGRNACTRTPADGPIAAWKEPR